MLQQFHQLNGLINSLDNLNIPFHFGSNGQLLEELHGKMFILYLIWNKMLELIM